MSNVGWKVIQAIIYMRRIDNGGTPRLAIVLEELEKVVSNKDVEIHRDLSRGFRCFWGVVNAGLGPRLAEGYPREP